MTPLTTMRTCCVLGMIVASAISLSPALADSWPPATELAVHSGDKAFRFRIIPRELRGALPYFEGLLEKRPRPGQEAGGQKRCFGILEKRAAKNSAFALIWSQPLLNDVAPVAAVVSDDGRYVATFDNWHAAGYELHALVIYGPGGEVIKKFGLLEFLQEPEIEGLSSSVSSVWWYGEALFERRTNKTVLRVDVRADVQVRVDAAAGTLLRSMAELAAIKAQVDQCHALKLTDDARDARKCRGAKKSDTWCALCGSLVGTK